MGAQVTQDLSVALLRIRKEMSVQLDIMQQMLQVSMAQLDMLQVRVNDLDCRWRQFVGSGVGCQ